MEKKKKKKNKDEEKYFPVVGAWDHPDFDFL